jgi:hypothetical protein
MIPRYQRIAYWCLVGGIGLMALLLVRGCMRNHERVIALRDQSPIAAPTDTPDETVTVGVADDADGSIGQDQITLSLPLEPSVRARVLLDRVLANSALPGSAHPVPPGPAIGDVFFLNLPIVPAVPAGSDTPQTERNSAPSASPYGTNHLDGAMLAVVSLTKPFADAHPSSVESEDLTLRLLIATLHDNFPQVDEVRFLVDGQTRETLAGHADLTRPYPVTDPARSIHPLAGDGSPE